MASERILTGFCVFLSVGLAAAKFDLSKVNITAMHKPEFSSNNDKAQPFWDPDLCDRFDDEQLFPHPDSCEEFLMCWRGNLIEGICPEGLLFDPVDLVCDEADSVVCLDDSWPDPDLDPDSECPPPNSNEVRFLPSNYCDEFYICINGQPILLQCRPGQHWNIDKEFCDDPESAGCDESAVNPPNQRLPDCPLGFSGSLPHPHNCNWFIHCSNGNRSIQQCQHLHHFDVNQGRCLFKNIAQCIKD